MYRPSRVNHNRNSNKITYDIFHRHLQQRRTHGGGAMGGIRATHKGTSRKLVYCSLIVFLTGILYFQSYYYYSYNYYNNNDTTKNDHHHSSTSGLGSVKDERRNELHHFKKENSQSILPNSSTENHPKVDVIGTSTKVQDEDDENDENDGGENEKDEQGDGDNDDDETLVKSESNAQEDDASQTTATATTSTSTSTSTTDSTCSFRTYKPNRYYPIHDLHEPFLADSEYIRGKLPFVLNQQDTATSHHQEETVPNNPNLLSLHKLCIDTSSWEELIPGHRPFSDGQNPSFVSLDKPTMDPNTLRTIQQLYGRPDIKDKYMGLLLFGDSQCRWNMTMEELEEYKFSPLQSAPSKRTMVLILDHDLQPLGEAVLELELDADWGKTRKKYKRQETHSNGSVAFNRIIVEMDDARLFFHNDQLHVLYRNGPSYGYEQQVQNIIHVELDGDHQFKAYIKASETFTVCCGRNIAFISELPLRFETMDHDAAATANATTTTATAAAATHSNTSISSNKNNLFALTWIDPVTTQLVNVPQSQTNNVRRLSEEEVSSMDLDMSLQQSYIRRRLASSKKKSSIHGTNGYMIPLHASSELLGIAHFHRPENRDTSDYARHGHHYTHAFFTIQPSPGKDNGSEIQFHLSRLSNEFVFLSPSSHSKDVADVIQFASGLDLIGSDDDLDGKIMISYGINDCEAAIMFVGLDLVNELLLPVNDGDEVIHVMKNLDL